MAYKSIFRVSTKDGNVGLFQSYDFGILSLDCSHIQAFNAIPNIFFDTPLRIIPEEMFKLKDSATEWLCAFNSKDDFFNYIADDEALLKLDSQGYVLSEYLVEDSLKYLRQSEYQSFFRKDKAIFKASFSLLDNTNPLFVNKLAA